MIKFGKARGAPVAHRVEGVPLWHSPDRSDPGLIPACCPSLHVLSSISQTFLSNLFLSILKRKKEKTLHLEWLINIRPGGKNRLRNRVHSAPPDLVLNGIMACSHFEMHSLPEAQGEVFIKE